MLVNEVTIYYYPLTSIWLSNCRIILLKSLMSCVELRRMPLICVFLKWLLGTQIFSRLMLFDLAFHLRRECLLIRVLFGMARTFSLSLVCSLLCSLSSFVIFSSLVNSLQSITSYHDSAPIVLGILVCLHSQKP